MEQWPKTQTLSPLLRPMGSPDIVKNGRNAAGNPRYPCRRRDADRVFQSAKLAQVGKGDALRMARKTPSFSRQLSILYLRFKSWSSCNSQACALTYESAIKTTPSCRKRRKNFGRALTRAASEKPQAEPARAF